MGLPNQNGQGGAVVPGGLAGALRQDDLPFQIDHSQPFQPVFPRTLLVAEVLHSADEIAADRALCQPGSIDGYRGRTSPPPRHAPHNLLEYTRYIFFAEPQQKAIQRGVVGNQVQLESGAQLGMFLEPDFGFPKGPVLITHQAQYRQQLRLREQPLAEFTAMSGQNGLADFQSQPGESNQSNLGHVVLRKCRSNFSLTRLPLPASYAVPSMSTEPAAFKNPDSPISRLREPLHKFCVHSLIG